MLREEIGSRREESLNGNRVSSNRLEVVASAGAAQFDQGTRAIAVDCEGGRCIPEPSGWGEPTVGIHMGRLLQPIISLKLGTRTGRIPNFGDMTDYQFEGKVKAMFIL